MAIQTVDEDKILEELRGLEPDRWFEVLDFIGYLKQRASTQAAQAHAQELTAHDLLQSDLVGLWADRDDIGDSLAFAHQLRRRAEHRRTETNAAT